MTANLLTLNSFKTEFLFTGLSKQLSKIHNSSFNSTDSARNLSLIFNVHLTFSDQISPFSKSCYYHIRQIRCIRPYLDSKTTSTIVTSIVHSKLNYTETLFISEWMRASRLRLNPTKTQVMWLGSGQQLKHVDINDIPLLSTTVQVVKSARDLGVILDSR